ncbi:unconventional myosin-Ib [Caerostris darwini]|uniref:Unconventional myosin-Ib n=1 Tax=Caerostris darwini TaxID=1538125 RepID=A0AAV4QN82_9ARAC|nr:unconventional myosin-Ib [Caerostris darwini]
MPMVKTYIGNVVVSVNPYKKLALYTTEVIHAYQRYSMYELPPHIYAAADASFRSMKDRNLDQSVIITGESGAGKTEACKCVMQYLAMVSGYASDMDCIKEQLLQSNFILEAFGNAKTHRNDNSSRFSRVVVQAQGERNFHIFYQLLSGADVHLLKTLKLQRNADKYQFLHESRCLHANNVDDKSSFIITRRAFDMLGFSADETLSTFQVASSVLKLGNVQFQPRANMDGTESCSLVNEYEVYEVSELLQGEVSVLQAALTQRTVETRHDVIVTDLSATEANYARNALCKALYSRLFTWLVNRINDTIRAKRIGKRKCIGMLDIYGFEVLEFNSFEQLIINYCNEKLQQILIELTLKAEQEEYIREGIQWEHIDYFNNAVICDLIEKSKNDLDLSLQNHHGILALLDEECLRPGPVSDETFLYKLTQACQDNPYFESRGCRNFVADSTLPHHSFRVRHYAGAVTYSVTGFIDKNNDILHRDLSQAMYKTDQPLLKTLFPEGNPRRTTLKRPTTTATQFRISLGALMKSIQGRNALYVRCIKPNELKQPMIFEMALVQHQVRYLGLMENVRMRKSGYAHRQDYESFLQRYKMLSPNTWPTWSGLPVEGVTNLLRFSPVHNSDYCFGRTKIFLKHSKTLYELERFRQESLHDLATLIQKVFRGWVHRRMFLQMRRSQIMLATNYQAWKRKRYLLWLSRHLPSESPLCRDWPPSPRCLQETSYYLRKLYHKWRCHKYRLRFDQIARNRMREKVTASMLFRDRKSSYHKSVSHPFRGDYVRLRHNVKWKKTAAETGDQYVVFADIINKIARASGKCLQTLFVVSTSAMLVMDQRTLQIKYRIPATDIFRISLSPFVDDLAVFHVRASEATRKKGDFLFETGHVIEIVTKLYLVIQNATGKPPEVNIATEFEANFGKESVVLAFKCTGLSEVQPGQVKIYRRGNRMEVVL